MLPSISIKCAVALLCATGLQGFSQGFVNLDFENATIVPIPNDPYGRVSWSAAVPGWTGFLGESQINWILFNDLFLSQPGISIFGPGGSLVSLEGQYYLQLKNAFPPSSSGIPAIVQTGTIPFSAQSLRFQTFAEYAIGLRVFLSGTELPLYKLESLGTGSYIWGSDISAFAGQSVELRFRGSDFLDDIRFSAIPIPEPSASRLFLLGLALALVRSRKQASARWLWLR